MLDINQWCSSFFEQCQNADMQNTLYKSCVLAIQRIMLASRAAKVSDSVYCVLLLCCLLRTWLHIGVGSEVDNKSN